MFASMYNVICIDFLVRSFLAAVAIFASLDIGYLMGMAHARQEERNRKTKSRKIRNTDDVTENIDIAKKCQ